MVIKEIIGDAVAKAGRTAENVLAAEVLLALCLGADREFLFRESGREVSSAVAERFFALFARFYQGEPLAYLTNRKEFYGLVFYVDDSVLIPRPETELLVENALKLMSDRDAPVRILEAGTGSGCISVALAKELSRARITATEISLPALEVARRNAAVHGVDGRIDFVATDLIGHVKGPFDFVVANLPYIGRVRFNFISREAEKYEPHLALFGGDDGLRLYERLFAQMVSRKWRPRYLLGEFGFLQSDEMNELLQKYFPAEKKEIIKDYASIDRIFMVGFGAQPT